MPPPSAPFTPHRMSLFLWLCFRLCCCLCSSGLASTRPSRLRPKRWPPSAPSWQCSSPPSSPLGVPRVYRSQTSSAGEGGGIADTVKLRKLLRTGCYCCVFSTFSRLCMSSLRYCAVIYRVLCCDVLYCMLFSAVYSHPHSRRSSAPGPHSQHWPLGQAQLALAPGVPTSLLTVAAAVVAVHFIGFLLG